MAQSVIIDIVTQLKDTASQGMGKMKGAADKLSASIEKTRRQAQRLGGTRTNVNLSLKDRATQGIEKTYRTLKSVAGKTWSTTVKLMDKATKPLQGIFKMLKSPILKAGAVLGVTMGAKDAVDTYVGFEKSMSNVQALSGEDTENMDKLTAKAREMGRTTTKSASEAADAMGYMALAGWDSKKIEVAIEPTLRLSEAGDMDLGRTSDLVTDSMSSLGLGADELTGYLDKVARTASKSNTDIDQLMESFLEIGGTVKQNDILLEQASALIGILANRGVKGSEAGVALNSVLVNLSTGAGQAGKAMKELGLSAFNSDGSFKGYADTLKELNDKTKDMTDEQKAYYLSAIGGKMRLSDLQKLLAGVSEEYDDLTKKIKESDGALAEMAKIKNDNIYGDIKAFQSAFDDLKITIVDKFQPHIRKFIQWITRGMLAINEPISKMADKAAEKIENLKKRINRVTSSFEWKGADLSEKIKIVWDKIIIEPFSQWWNGSGKAWMEEKAHNIGHGIGAGLSGGILALLGIPLEDAANGGFSIGKSFADGFLDGFDAEAVWNGLKAKLAEGMKSAGKILPGGEKATAGSWLWAGLLSAGAFKLGRGAIRMSGIKNIIPVAETGAASVSAVSRNAVSPAVAGTLGAVSRTKTIANQAKDTKFISGLASTSKEYTDFWKNTDLHNGVISRQGLRAEQQAVISGASQQYEAARIRTLEQNIEGIQRRERLSAEISADIATGDAARQAAAQKAARSARLKGAGRMLKANGLSIALAGVSVATAENKTQETVRQAGGLAGSIAGSSFGSLAGAAAAKWIGGAIGTAIAPGVGTAIGTALGGLAGSLIGYVGGTEFGQKVYDLFKSDETRKAEAAEEEITKEKEKQKILEEQMYNLSDSYDNLKYEEDRIAKTKELEGTIKGLQKSIAEDNLNEDEKAFKQEEIKDSFQQLVDMYPDLLNYTDIENGKLEYQLGLVDKINDSKIETPKYQFENDLMAANENFDTLKSNKLNADSGKQKAEADQKKFAADKAKILDSYTSGLDLKEKWQDAKKSGDKDKAKDLYGDYLNMCQQLRDNLKDAGFNTKDLMNAAQSKGKTSYDWEEIEQFLREKKTELNTNSIAADNNFVYSSQQAQQLYDMNLQKVDYDLGDKIGMSLDTAIAKYDELDAQTKKVVRDSVKEVSNLNYEFASLATTKYGDFILRVRGENLQLLDQYPVFKKGAATVVKMANVFNGMSQFDSKKATGDIVSKAHIALIGEAGPEAIIPLSGTNKHRGVKLWEETGHILGTLPKHANGGIFGKVASAMQSNSIENKKDGATAMPPINIQLGGMTFTFNGTGAGDKEGIMVLIREQMPEITNDIADKLAAMLAQVFSNMKMQAKGV